VRIDFGFLKDLDAAKRVARVDQVFGPVSKSKAPSSVESTRAWSLRACRSRCTRRSPLEARAAARFAADTGMMAEAVEKKYLAEFVEPADETV
jgi:hypothetical protein